MSRLPALITAALFVSGTAQAAADGPSFDCAAAANPAEKMICASPKLAALDMDIARLYKTALAKLEYQADALRAEQQRWLTMRDGLCHMLGTAALPRSVAQSSDEEACLTLALSLRRAALVATDERMEANPPFCERISQTLSDARTPDGGLIQAPLVSQLVAAGLLIPASPRALTPDWRKRLSLMPEPMGDEMALVPFGANHVAVTRTGGTARCLNFTVYALNANGTAGPALRAPEDRSTIGPYCWTETTGFGTDGSGQPVFFAEDAGTTHPLPGPHQSNVRIYLAQTDRWSGSCRVEMNYDLAFRLGKGTCAGAAPVCRALAEATSDWAEALATSSWNTQAVHADDGPAYPFLPGLSLRTDPPPEETRKVPDFTGWTSRHPPNFEDGTPTMSWQGPVGPLIIRLSPSSIDLRVGPMILGAWRQQGETLLPVAGYVINQVRVGTPKVKTIATHSVL